MEPSNSSVRIRMAAPDDAVSIASVLYESFVEYESLYTPEGFAATTPAIEQIQNRIKEGPVWVAIRDHTIIGTVAAVPQAGALYIRSMAILPTERGLRIGESLLKQIESFAAERGCKRLFLSTTPFLSRAIRLYEHYGFRPSNEGPHDLFGTPLLTMEKDVESSD